MVAEKPSLALSIAKILSHGRQNTRKGMHHISINLIYSILVHRLAWALDKDRRKKRIGAYLIFIVDLY